MVANKYRGSREYLLVYSELINAARYRGTITYKSISSIMGLPPSGHHMAAEVGWLLGEISEDEVNQGRPMLSALAIGAKGSPGGGFYGLAVELGKLKDDSEEGKRKFWESEREAACEAWNKWRK
jgi:hypothetical protein